MCQEFRICPIIHNFKKITCNANDNTDATMSQKTDTYYNVEVKLLTPCSIVLLEISAVPQLVYDLNQTNPLNAIPS